MKKLTKLLGLLLVAGAMFVGCQQEANIDTNEVKLSDGKWDIVTSMSTKIKRGLYTGSLSYGSSETINVSGDTYTYISYSMNQGVSFTLPEGTDEKALTAFATAMTSGESDEGENKPTVLINGTTITITNSTTATAEEIEEMNEQEHKISEDYTSELPEGVVIKTNKKKTEYIVTWVVAAEDEDDFDSNYTMTMKKQK